MLINSFFFLNLQSSSFSTTIMLIKIFFLLITLPHHFLQVISDQTNAWKRNNEAKYFTHRVNQP